MALPPDRAADSERASILFGVALTQMGVQATGDALSLWQDVPPVSGAGAAKASANWLEMTVRYVKRRRLRARDLALAYYRYQRALTTGTTIALPGKINPPYLTLPELKREFEAYLSPQDLAPEASDSASTTDGALEAPEAGTSEPARPQTPAEPVDDDEAAADELDQILVEEIKGLQEELDELERQADAEVREALQNLGLNNQERKLRDIDPESTAAQADTARQEANKAAGRRQAAAVGRVVQNGARGPLHHVATRDTKVIGFVRVSSTGTPCGFCAMLISRGPVFKSAQGSSLQVTFGDLDLYHDNCYCYAVPIFDLAQYESDSLFALNREYAELWPKVTKGLGGKSAISAWRRFIRQQARSQKSQEAAA